jgi:hypothetical protein
VKTAFVFLRIFWVYLEGISKTLFRISNAQTLLIHPN